MATARDCIQNYVLDIERWLESGNHDLDSFDYVVFRLDWVVSNLVRFSDSERLDVRVIKFFVRLGYVSLRTVRRWSPWSCLVGKTGKIADPYAIIIHK